MHLIQIVADVQGVYFILTGAWPLVHIRSFMAVTGPKTDAWIVRTVGLVVLVVCVAVALALAGWRHRVTAEAAFLAVVCAAGLAGIVVVYVVRRVIARIYLADAAAEAALIASWAWALLWGENRPVAAFTAPA